MNIKENIELCNGKFYKSINIGELDEAIKTLKKTIDNQYINESNKDNAIALLYRLHMKVLLLKYFVEYKNDLYDIAIEYCDRALPMIKKAGYQKTEQAFENSKHLLNIVYSIMKDYSGEFFKITDKEHSRLTSSIKDCNEVIKYVDESIAKLDEINVVNPFGKKITFIDAKTICLDHLNKLKLLALVFIEEIEKKNLETFMKTNTKDITELYTSAYKYYPVINLKDYGYANSIVISSPILEEVYLYVASFSKINGVVKVMSAQIFKDMSALQIVETFRIFSESRYNCLITNMNDYHGDNIGLIYSEIMKLGKAKCYVFVHDTSGDRSLYYEALKIASNDQELGSTAISHIFLTMPVFSDVKDLFIELKMINMEDKEKIDKIKKQMPFMGFAGLNAVVRCHSRGEDWLGVGRDKSKAHDKAVIKRYISKLPSQYQFIDNGWGDYSDLIKAEQKNKKSFDFDYDTIRVVNKENIKIIVESDFNLTCKCGLVARYCVFAGDDISNWKRISEEEKEERLTLATQLLFELLNVQIKPIVTIEENLGKNIVGLCCDGGKVIKYKRSAVNRDPADTINTICHESRHAFQHYATDGAYQEWFYRELGLMEGIIAEWRYNFQNGNYFQPSKNQTAYLVQVVESDARAFANDCIKLANDAWSKLKLI